MIKCKLKKTAKAPVLVGRVLFALYSKVVVHMARPNKYETHVKPHLEEIKAAYARGVDEKEIASSLGVSVSAWCDYKNKYSEFAEVLKRDAAATADILQRLDNALLKVACGYEYEEITVYTTTDDEGKTKTHKEKKKKHQPPNVTAIFGAYNRYDPNYIKDKAYYDLKREELDLKKAIAEANNFDLEF